MSQGKSLLEMITKERPVGTKTNTQIIELLNQMFQSYGYKTKEIPFACVTWEHGASKLVVDGDAYEIYASPFSNGFDGEGALVTASTLKELQERECTDSVLVLGQSLAKEQLQPKDYPFYYPPEHDELIKLLEAKKPAAIIAATKNQLLSGLNPFPMFEDGNFLIPTGYMKDELYAKLCSYQAGSKAKVRIVSEKKSANSCQLIARKEAASGNHKGRIVICAHMDSKYDTAAALDNATGVAVMMETAKRIQIRNYTQPEPAQPEPTQPEPTQPEPAKPEPTQAEPAQAEQSQTIQNNRIQDYDIEFVPMNGEEYYESSGELCYLEYMNESKVDTALVINIDSPCHIGSKIGYSLYNFSQTQTEDMNQLLTKHPDVCEGEQWYAGDHAMFAFSGTPCIAVSSSDLFEGALDDTHTMRDVLEHVDASLIETAADWICDVIESFSMK